jgi:hypothetical protein
VSATLLLHPDVGHCGPPLHRYRRRTMRPPDTGLCKPRAISIGQPAETGRTPVNP